MYISQQLFNEVFQEITEADYVPYFSQNMIREESLLLHYQQLHEYLLDETNPALMKMALTSLIRELIQVCELTPSQPENDAQRKAILLKEYIHEHYLENIRLDVLGEEMGLSKCYLIRLFESVYGLSPIRYAINLRIEDAKKLLYQGVKYTEVAYSTGFYDQSHFIRHFKKIVGVTPKAFC
jgi:AraC-like DNA-binding protein